MPIETHSELVLALMVFAYTFIEIIKLVFKRKDMERIELPLSSIHTNTRSEFEKIETRLTDLTDLTKTLYTFQQANNLSPVLDKMSDALGKLCLTQDRLFDLLKDIRHEVREGRSA